jgi:xylulokinase
MESDTYLLGLDLGTSTVKAGLYTLDGRELAVAGDEYLVIAEGATTVDVDPEAFWQGICGVVRRVLEQHEGARPRASPPFPCPAMPRR